MADIFQEIDEELRQDRAAKLWNRYGKYVIVAALVVVLAVGSYKYWVAQDLAARAAESAAYQSAIQLAEEGDVVGAINSLGSLAEDANSGYAVLARLRQAGLAAGRGDNEVAVRAYDIVAGDGSVSEDLRALARLRSVALRIGTGDPGAISSTLERLAMAGSPWRLMSVELQGAIALRTGDMVQARKAFITLADDAETPRAMRARAAEMLKALPTQ